MKKHAILLSGGVNSTYNYERYKNDLTLAYNALKNVGNFEDKNIDLFFGIGLTSFANVDIIPQAALEYNVLSCFKRNEEELSEDDEFVLVVSNHGGDENGGNICLWGDMSIELRCLAEYLNRIKARKIVILGECYGGNILKYDIQNSCIFTANEYGKPSYAHITRKNKSYVYDEFIYHFFSFILGCYPDTGNRIPHGGNDLVEAYVYAKENDIFNPDNNRSLDIRTEEGRIIEIPQMKNNLLINKIEF